MKLRMQSRLEEIQEVSRQLAACSAEHGLTRSLELELAVTEALNNCVLHAHKGALHGIIDVELHRVGSYLEVAICDHVATTPPAWLPDPGSAQEPIPKLEATGRGLALMSELSDQLLFSDGWLRMRFLINPTE